MLVCLKRMQNPAQQMTFIQFLLCSFMLIASIDMSLGAASLVAKGPIRVDVSTLKQFPIEQMGFFGK